MAREWMRGYVELLGLYGWGLECTLRATRVLADAMEQSLEAQMELADTLAARMTTLAAHPRGADLAGAQSALARLVNEQAAATADRLIRIQHETGEDLRALLGEGAGVLLPPAAGGALREAA